MKKLIAVAIVLLGTSSVVMAQACAVGCTIKAPEIDPTMGIQAAALLLGTVLTIRGRRKAS